MERILYIDSNIKTDISGFNDLPERSSILESIGLIKEKIQFVDVINYDYWKNDIDTLVIETTKTGLLKLLASRLRPDEFDYIELPNKKCVARFWWD